MTDRSVIIRLGLQATGYIQGMDQVARKTRDAGSEAEKLAQKKEGFDLLGRSALGFGAAMVTATGFAVKSAIDWESAWTGVTKTVDASAGTLDLLEGNLRQLARTLPASHQEIAAVAEAAGQLGVKAADIASFTKVMIDLGETTNLSSEEAATSLAQFMNIMQTAPSDVGRLGAAVVALGNNGASTERDIVQMSQRIAGAGKTIGLSEGEVLGFANALASAGIEVDAGGSAISNIMIDIAKSVSSGGDKLETFASVSGLSAAAFSKAFKDDPATAIATFIEGLGRVNEAGGDVFGTLETLGQSDVRVTRALLGMASSGNMLRNSLKLGNDAFEENTALLTEAEKRYGTTEAQMQMLSNRVNDAAIDFGQVFLPAINVAMKGVGEFADSFADLDPVLQGTLSSGAALIGVIALTGGAALLAVPKIAQYKVALDTLGVAGGGAGGALMKVGRFLAGPWGIAIATAAAGLAGLTAYVDSLKASSTEMTASIKGSTDAYDQFVTHLEGEVANPAGEAKNQLAGLEAALQDGADNWKDWTNGVSGYNDTILQTVSRVGKSIGEMAATDLPSAQQGFRRLAEYTNGSDRQLWQLLSTTETYRDALIAQAKSTGDYSEKMSDAEKKQVLLTLAMGPAEEALDTTRIGVDRLAESTTVNTAALEEWLKVVAESDAGFIGLKTSYDNIVQGNKDYAQSVAESTEDSTDSWETYYDGFTVNVDEYLADLQRQVDAQTNWESNMILLSGRVSSGVLDELAKLGPEGAPLVAALTTATDTQLAQMEKSFGERTAAATSAFSTTLAGSGPVIEAASAQLGEGAAREIADKLAAGTSTVEEIVREYGLKIEGMKPKVTVDPSGADNEMQGIMNRWQGTTIKLNATARWSSAVMEAENYAGGIYQRGVQAFAAGGFASGIYPGVDGGIHKFAEKEMGVPWETYISGRGSDRTRNIGIWAETGRRLGAYQAAPASYAATPISPSVQAPAFDPGLAADIRKIARMAKQSVDEPSLSRIVQNGSARRASLGE